MRQRKLTEYGKTYKQSLVDAYTKDQRKKDMMGLVSEMSKSKVGDNVASAPVPPLPAAASTAYSGPIIRPATFNPDPEMDSLSAAFKTMGKGRGKRKTRKNKRKSVRKTS